MDLYPLKFVPIVKERLWGGTKLRDVLGKRIENDTTGESWELSGVCGDISVVANGPLKGKSLQELIDGNGSDLLGVSVKERFGTNFPILIKYIDAQKDLSIQLHPNDELAKRRHDSFGKTEMWYVMDAEPDATLIVGFNKSVTKEEYTQSLEDDTLLDLLNYEKVTEGDTFFINTGKIHAIGAGVLLAEIQQTSDITYRVFDFNRKDKNGNLRELHTEMALDAMDFERKDDFKVSYDKAVNECNKMVHNPYFQTDFVEVEGRLHLNTQQRDSFTIFMGIGGTATIECDLGNIDIAKGETVLVPAAAQYIELNSPSAKLLQVTL